MPKDWRPKREDWYFELFEPSNYDGDTVRGYVDKGMGNYEKIRIRLSEVDTHELRDKDPKRKKKAYEAKKVTKKFLAERPVFLRTVKTRSTGTKTGKYGRFLGYVYHTEIEAHIGGLAGSLNKLLLDKGLDKSM